MRQPVSIVRSPADWELLVSPVRSEIIEALRIFGPCSIAEVAASIDRPADALYRHVDLLIKGGFVREAGFRKGERNVEQLIDVVAEDFNVEFSDNQGQAENRAIVRTADSYLKAMGRAVRDSALSKQLVFTERGRNISINYELSWLRPDDYAEVRALIRRLKQIMDEGKKRREGRLYMSLAIATPVTRKRGARPTARPAARGPKGQANQQTNPQANRQTSRQNSEPSQDANVRRTPGHSEDRPARKRISKKPKTVDNLAVSDKAEQTSTPAGDSNGGGRASRIVGV
ncbi:MAG: helix-turn-helix domain-containing protein [Planctomycetota bacterium]|nr:helix-turn-helix domain-containing protein [Planctomycetota bacterium]